MDHMRHLSIVAKLHAGNYVENLFALVALCLGKPVAAFAVRLYVRHVAKPAVLA